MEKIFKILSIDGGGLRGIYSAHILERIEQEFEINWSKHFSLLAGTSTGSIIASGLALGHPAEKIKKFYVDYGEKIFKSRLRSKFDILKIFTSKYSSRFFQKKLNEVFGDTTLGNIPVPLILPSVDIGNGNVHVFKSKYSDGFIRDPDVKIVDAILASCSAPTYFNPHNIDKYQLIDGGLWANNPALVAVIDAKYRLGIPLEDIRVFSVGTGSSKVFYPHSNGLWYDKFIRSWQGWGFATRWGRGKLIDFILNLQAESTHNMLSLLLGESPLNNKKICRISFESDMNLPMDSYSKILDWINRADKDFSHKAKKIQEFLKLKNRR